MSSNTTIAGRAAAWFGCVALLAIVVSMLGCGVALAVVNGKTVSITAVPWTVVVREYGQQECTGVIIDPSQVLTAGHCVMSDNGNSAEPLPASDLTVQAGVSNAKHPLKSDHPQFRSVIAVRAMPGHIAASKETSRNYLKLVAHDLAVLTLSHRLDLRGDDARAAYLPAAGSPTRWRGARLVAAGFGAERFKGLYVNGTLNEVVKSTIRTGCGTSQVLCAYQTTTPCDGDSGAGIVDVQSRPTVLGILSATQQYCRPGLSYYVFLGSPAALRFIHASMRARTVIRPLPAIAIVCALLVALGVWRIRHRNEKQRP